MTEQKELIPCWYCGSDKVIGFKLTSVRDGTVIYDIECDDCRIQGSITKELLDLNELKFWKVYGEDSGWKIGSSLAPVE